MLRSNGVTDLVDVRSYPTSRKFPQWERTAIAESLPPDIAYHWIAALGGRRHTPAGTPTANGAWRVKAFRDYADYMATDEFAAGLQELLDLLAHRTPAIMCSEALPWRCHRRLITDALIAHGVEVCDILTATSTRPAKLTGHARTQAGRVTYPP